MRNRFAHTPGPWAITVLPTIIIIESARGCVCEIASHWSNQPKRRVANARLIAAAPKMFKVLSLLLAGADDKRFIREALAEAEGGAP